MDRTDLIAKGREKWALKKKKKSIFKEELIKVDSGPVSLSAKSASDESLRSEPSLVEAKGLIKSANGSRELDQPKEEPKIESKSSSQEIAKDQEIKLLKQKLTESDEQMSELRLILEQRAKDFAHFMQQKSQTENEKKKFKEENEDLLNQLSAMDEQLTLANEKVVQANKINKELESMKKELTEERRRSGDAAMAINKLNKTQDELETLIGEVEIYKGLIAQKDSEIKALQSEIVTPRKPSGNQFQEEIVNLRTNLERISVELSQVNVKLENTKTERDELSRVNDVYQSKMQSQLIELDDLNVKWDAVVESLRGWIKEPEEGLSNFVESVGPFCPEDLQETIKGLQDVDKAQFDNQLDSTMEMSELALERDHLFEEKEKILQEIKELRNDQQMKEEQISSLIKEKQALLNDSKLNESKIKELTDDLGSIKNIFELERKQFEEQTKESDQIIETLNDQLKAKEEEIEKLIGQIESNDSLGALQDQITQLANEKQLILEKLNNEKESREIEIEELKTSMNTVITRLKDEKQEATAQLEELKATMDTHSALISEKEKTISNLIKQVDQLKNEKETVTALLEELKSTMNDRSSELVNEKRKSEEREREISDLIKQVEYLKAQIKNLEERSSKESRTLDERSKIIKELEQKHKNEMSARIRQMQADQSEKLVLQRQQLVMELKAEFDSEMRDHIHNLEIQFNEEKSFIIKEKNQEIDHLKKQKEEETESTVSRLIEEHQSKIVELVAKHDQIIEKKTKEFEKELKRLINEHKREIETQESNYGVLLSEKKSQHDQLMNNLMAKIKEKEVLIEERAKKSEEIKGSEAEKYRAKESELENEISLLIKSNEKLKEEISSLKSHLEQSKEDQAHLNDQVTVLQNSIKEFESDHEAEVNALKEKQKKEIESVVERGNLGLEKSLKLLKQEKKELEYQIKSIREQQEKQSKEIKEIHETNLLKLQSQSEQIIEELKRNHQSEIEKLEMKLAVSSDMEQDKFQEIVAENSALNETLTQEQKKLNEALEVAEEMEREVERLTQEHMLEQERYQENIDQISCQHQKELDSLKSQLTSVDHQRRAESEELFEQEKSRLKNEFDQLVAKHQQQAKSAVQKLQEEFQREQENHSQRIKELKQRLRKSIQKEGDELKELSQLVSLVFKETRDSFKSANDQIRLFSFQFSSLSNVQLNPLVSGNLSSFDSIKSVLIQYHCLVEKLNQEKISFNQKIDHLVQEKDALSVKSTDLGFSKGKLEIQINQLLNSINQLKEKNDSLEIELSNKDHDIVLLNERLEKIELVQEEVTFEPPSAVTEDSMIMEKKLDALLDRTDQKFIQGSDEHLSRIREKDDLIRILSLEIQELQSGRLAEDFDGMSLEGLQKICGHQKRLLINYESMNQANEDQVQGLKQALKESITGNLHLEQMRTIWLKEVQGNELLRGKINELKSYYEEIEEGLKQDITVLAQEIDRLHQPRPDFEVIKAAVETKMEEITRQVFQRVQSMESKFNHISGKVKAKNSSDESLNEKLKSEQEVLSQSIKSLVLEKTNIIQQNKILTEQLTDHSRRLEVQRQEIAHRDHQHDEAVRQAQERYQELSRQYHEYKLKIKGRLDELEQELEQEKMQFLGEKHRYQSMQVKLKNELEEERVKNLEIEKEMTEIKRASERSNQSWRNKEIEMTSNYERLLTQVGANEVPQSEMDALRHKLRSDARRHQEQITILANEIKFLGSKYHRETGLRADLIYQKKFLLILLGGKDACDDLTVQLINKKRTHDTPSEKLRRVLTTVLALQRIKLLAKKWASAKQVRRSILSKHEKNYFK